ncbi:hypothetical protein Lal_00014011 [Lupinus albus]|nr:hypothetical protein Lal_00014011 [Lupinus albus]
MAANSSITTLGKRVTTRIFSKSTSPLSNSRRAAYSSLYDKNPDDQIHSGPVPDDVIHSTNSGNYWAPHPQTGIFGPPGETTSSTGDRSFHSASTADPAGSVLEVKAWFRPTSLEDLEKPNTHP